MTQTRIRCPWSEHSPLEVAYHDAEWGVPRYDDAGQFEFLVLESAQAGLSWLTILKKREGYRNAFAQFSPEIIATFTDRDVERLLQDTGIVRNRLKVLATISNARLFLELAARHGSFSSFIWNYVDAKPIVNHWKTIDEVPATTTLSDRLAKDMKKLGFKFLGSTVLYAHMQATGIVNDHLVSCFRHAEVQQ